MKAIILAVLLGCTLAAVSLDLTKSCQCSDFKQSGDCSGGCMWENSACRTKVCKDYTTQATCYSSMGCKWASNACADTTTCGDWTTEADCDSAKASLNCAWATTCKAFTACADYVPGTTGCPAKSSTSQRCQLNTSTNKCENAAAAATTTCTGFTTQATCIASSTTACVWVSNACKDFSACSSADGASTYCTGNSACKYASDKCVANTCDSRTTDATCTYIPSFDRKTGNLCQWKDSKCQDAADKAFLTSSTCMTNTGGSHAWSGSACNACTGGSNGYLLAIIVGLLVLLF